MPDTGIGKLIEREMLNHGRPPQAETIVLDNLETIMECVAAQLGFTLLPYPDIARYRTHDIKTLAAPKAPTRKLVFVTPRDSVLDQNRSKLVSFLGQ